MFLFMYTGCSYKLQLAIICAS